LVAKEGELPPLLKAPTVGWKREVRRDFLMFEITPFV
jgi:hypothetical protein